MDVIFNESRSDSPTIEVHYVGIVSDRLFYIRTISHSQNTIARGLPGLSVTSSSVLIVTTVPLTKTISAAGVEATTFDLEIDDSLV